jgi:RHS repeat-associated protein
VQNNTFDRVVFEYDVAGVRVSKTVIISGSSTKEYYIGGLVVQSNNTVKYFAMAEGRVRNNSGTLTYEYFITDQQGNTRVSFEDNGSGTAVVRQENSYYAFGMPMAGNYMPGDANKKLYNAGSEWQDEFGGIIDYYSTFFREYDPVIGRFNSVDPKAELTVELSIYHYAGNNPVNFNDPMGDWFGDGVREGLDFSRHGWDWSASNKSWGIADFKDLNYHNPMYLLYEALKELAKQGKEITSLSLTNVNDYWSASVGFSQSLPPHQTGTLPAIFGNGYESKDLHQVIIGTKLVSLGYWKEGSNFVEGIRTLAGLGIGVAEFFGFREGEWWFSYRQMKFYDWSVPGNRYTGGKLKHSGAIHSVVTWAGRALGVYNSFSIMSDYQSGKISMFTMLAEQGSNAISTFARSPFALGWTIGWEGGRWLTSHSWYRKFRANVQNFFGHPDEESRSILRTQEVLDIKIPEY